MSAYNETPIMIYALQTDDDWYTKTAQLARTCSFQGSGQYLYELMTAHAFSDYERVFAACSDNAVIGFCVIAKESCCENDPNAPWLDFLFVSEEFRCRGIARALIKTAMEYARSCAFTELFLCTAAHEDFYKKLGFESVYDTKINDCTTGKVMRMVIG